VGRPGELDEVLTALDELLVNCGYADKASWVRRRRDRLRDPSAADEQGMLESELRRFIHGPDGLQNLTLNPSRTSGLTRDSAQQRFDDLATHLWILTADGEPGQPPERDSRR
jgi:hypothetical protein